MRTIVKSGLTYAKSLTIKHKFTNAIQIYLVVINHLETCIRGFNEVLRNSEDEQSLEDLESKLFVMQKLLVVALLATSFCYEQIFDLDRMVLALKSAKIIAKLCFERDDEMLAYISKMVKLTNRKYTDGYNSQKEMKTIVM